MESDDGMQLYCSGPYTKLIVVLCMLQGSLYYNKQPLQLCDQYDSSGINFVDIHATNDGTVVLFITVIVRSVSFIRLAST